MSFCFPHSCLFPALSVDRAAHYSGVLINERPEPILCAQLRQTDS
jgi:hypothetical protein